MTSSVKTEVTPKPEEMVKLLDYMATIFSGDGNEHNDPNSSLFYIERMGDYANSAGLTNLESLDYHVIVPLSNPWNSQRQKFNGLEFHVFGKDALTDHVQLENGLVVMPGIAAAAGLDSTPYKPKAEIFLCNDRIW